MKLSEYSKSKVLEKLSPILKSAIILPQYNFTYANYKNNKEKIISDISRLDFKEPFIVRSSSKNEDNDITSNAGHFESKLNVSLKDIEYAIEEVFNSYENDVYKNDNLVFIQPMLNNILLSGVIFTKDPSSGSYYYIVNYDDTTSSTETVTSGSSNNLKIFYHFKGKDISKLDDNMYKIISLAKELENIFDQDNLDIEFAMDKNHQLYLFQVRTLHSPKPDFSMEEISAIMNNISNVARKFFSHHPYLFGERSILGVMPDWNPAEIIGIRPKKLALSLYKELITDRQWAYQRFEYKYRNLKSFPLIYDFSGLPYIDVRVSFNSFIPISLEDKIAKKLADFYLKELSLHNEYHDKIEFEITLSCYTFDMDKKIDKLKKYGFTDTEINAICISLKDLTNNIIKDNKNLTYKDYKKISELQDRQYIILNSNLSTEDKIYWLLEDCKRYGTLAFAGLARAGFIAVELLKSLVSASIFSENDFQDFMSSIKSITSNIYNDFLNLHKEEFLNKYGHLRPGTYDINSKRYDEKEYFIYQNTKANELNKEFKISLKTIQELDNKLKEHSLDCSASNFLSFCKFAIEAREYGKYVFTKSLSDSLKLLEEYGNSYGFSRSDMSYFDIKDFYTYYTTSENRHEILSNSINKGKLLYKKSLYFNFPPLITNYNELFSFHINESVPNYITIKEIEADIVILNNLDLDNFDLTGKIVLIPSADPGYDWLFSHNIAGLITKYGGANSHMAIRAAELSLPSIIGCGETLFEKYSLAKRLYINCSNKECKIIL